ncbi:MAG: hypothetical protein A2086_08705 [Spirochaetes bacterium GWD1_27_9]|nr:MAG: hypothetical protein A2Z98_13085 [Spirochaetes bacterium GWB1_27_13]OHD25002.1 MAG: hypothetical protein A2Y34_13555 [Spirochaetes bacterium GWC1_27_15]OHD40480.1 MAG: hypothetical protein A2086_08705 [Spirochaetes bacterium GWD1_27_9]
MKIFIDTSSLVKRYLVEIGSEKLDLLFDESDDIFVSFITEIEFNSSLKRRLFDYSINEMDYQYILNEFYQDLKDFSVIEYSLTIKNRAIDLIKKHQIKTLDSIQLSCVNTNIIDKFITSDEKLYNASLKEFKNKSILIK